ncbi:glycosyl hydrolase family 18 protein [Paenibacillus sp. SC116]|uniref:carbohydrate-binding protein n=1 Tax=Paenibacillus sp. SC116 TaxID=2968986 RepID=UPI00215A98E7|nr:glycosyl hydrolase family 18 protein [Paenibacillus sp. SC116]MCR8844875.1 glycosyl hydrolase family 18 protein [Paenibacillus sp. SC116]
MYSSIYRRSIRPLSVMLVAVLFVLLIPFQAFGASAWAPNTAYQKGAIVTYQNVNYECTQTHTSLNGWEPPNVPALWKQSNSPVDTTPPTAPSSLVSPVQTTTTITLAWQASTDNIGVQQYRIYSGTTQVGTATSSPHQITGLSPNTLYSYTVRAADAAGNVSADSNTIQVRTAVPVVDNQPPTVPTNLRSTNTTNSTISLAWDASQDNIGVSQYEVIVNGQVAGTSAQTTFTITGLAASTTYAIAVRAVDEANNRSANSTIASITTKDTAAVAGKVLVGYWHNFNNGSTNIRLRDISPNFDVINVAFAEPIGDRATMAFTPYNATKEQFKADIAELRSKGKKVQISIGGAEGTVELNTEADKQNFIRTMNAIITEYKFDGLDIDLEGSSLALAGGDTNFRNPTTPKIVNLIAAVREILSTKSAAFQLTMAPETAYVQGGLVAYGGPWGAYLPVIHAFKDRMNFIHVQHYNTGSMTALDGRSYSQGTTDFQVAMAEMLLAGFPIGNNPNNMFPALREDQVAIGLPANQSAAGGGYTNPADIDKALKYITKGISYGGSYVLRKPTGYPGFRGVMTWSINWDKVANFGFSNPVRSSLNSLN